MKQGASQFGALETEGIGLVRAFRVHRAAPQRLRLPREPDPGIELERQLRLEIVGEELRLGPVDDADGALEERLGELGADGSLCPGPVSSIKAAMPVSRERPSVGIVAGRALRA